MRVTLLDLNGQQVLMMGSLRDVTEREQQARWALRLAQATPNVAVRDSIDAILEGISECVLAGTRALAAWVTLIDEAACTAPCVNTLFLPAEAPDPPIDPVARTAIARLLVLLRLIDNFCVPTGPISMTCPQPYTFAGPRP